MLSDAVVWPVFIFASSSSSALASSSWRSERNMLTSPAMTVSSMASVAEEYRACGLDVAGRASIMNVSSAEVAAEQEQDDKCQNT